MSERGHLTRFDYVVSVEAETRDQAETVLGVRLGPDEEIDPDDGGPFEYAVYYRPADDLLATDYELERRA